MVAASAIGLSALGRSAHADTIAPARCIAANEEAGPLRRAGKLREARARLRLCAATSCPAAVQRDCIALATEVDREVPSVAFSVQDAAGNDIPDVRVSLDGQPIADKLDGKALDVDPGDHVFRFESSAFPPIEKRLVIIVAEKNRRERVLIGGAKPVVPVVVATVPVVPASSPSNGRRNVGLAVGGTGLGLLAAGGVSGIVAVLEWSAAKNACGPTFPDSCRNQSAATSDRSATLVASAVADVALGVGAAALITGAVLVLTVPVGGARTGRLTVAPRMSANATGMVIGGTF